MDHDPTPPRRDERALDEMTAALRDAGADESDALPPEVRRSTLQALWVADATRYETRSARNAKVLRYATALVAAAVVVAVGGVFVRLATRAWEYRNAPERQYGITRTPVPPAPATHPTTTQTAPTEPVEPTVSAAPVGPPPVVSGRVVFLGTPPEPDVISLAAVPECRSHRSVILDDSLVVGDGGGLANVVVSLERDGGAPLAGPAPTTPAVLDQRGCQYVPHVLAVSVGQPITVRNSDPFLHNVHSLAVDNPAFNFGQPSIDPGRRIDPMKVAERFRIKCDVHPWMNAHVSVFDHTYFAVTGTDGAFAIPGTLPDGQYTLTAWHEKLGEKRAIVVVSAGKPATADFVFDGAALLGG